MKEFEIDWPREERTGIAEAILCDGKSCAQIAAILSSANGKPLLLTRLDEQKASELAGAHRMPIDYDTLSRTAFFGQPKAPSASGIGIICGGTSDLPVALEAARTLLFSGHEAALIADVGVAGLWRLMNHLKQIRGFSVIIAVAGMEGALFSVVSGLVTAPVIAVPTSVGYGVALGGKAALFSALASCSAGNVTVNIDNGFGAACAAMKMMRINSATS